MSPYIRGLALYLSIRTYLDYNHKTAAAQLVSNLTPSTPD